MGSTESRAGKFKWRRHGGRVEQNGAKLLIIIIEAAFVMIKTAASYLSCNTGHMHQ